MAFAPSLGLFLPSPGPPAADHFPVISTSTSGQDSKESRRERAHISRYAVDYQLRMQVADGSDESAEGCSLLVVTGRDD